MECWVRLRVLDLDVTTVSLLPYAEGLDSRRAVGYNRSLSLSCLVTVTDAHNDGHELRYYCRYRKHLDTVDLSVGS